MLHKATPCYFIYVYNFFGIVPFYFKPGNSEVAKIFPQFAYFPIILYFVYVCITWKTIINRASISKAGNYIDLLSNIGSLLSMITAAFRNRHQILTYLEQIEKTPPPPLVRNHHKPSSTLHVIFITYAFVMCLFVPFFDSPLWSAFFYLLPVYVNSFDHLFLSDVLSLVGRHFDDITYRLKNIHNQEYVNCDEIEDLSCYHCRLVDISYQVTRHFEITTIVSMVMWFAHTVDSLYFVLFGILHQKHPSQKYVFFTSNFIFLSFLLLWFFVMLKTFVETEAKVWIEVK